MLSFLRAQVLHRRGRAAALGAGIFVAAVSFVLLVASVKTSQLRVRGSVAANFHTAYDILVRPPGSFTELERSRGLVRDNYLSGIFGGISLREYREVRSIRGVEVAAPIANVGYIMPRTFVPVKLDRLLTKQPFQLYRIVSSYVAQRGLSEYPAITSYVYYTRRDRFINANGVYESPPGGGAPLPICFGFGQSLPIASGPFDFTAASTLSCYSARSKPRAGYAHFVGAPFAAYYPIVIAAIDPVEESRLLALRETITGGRYLREGEGVVADKKVGLRFVPVIASTRNYVDDVLDVDIHRLGIPEGTDVPQALASGACAVAEFSCPPEDVIQPPPGSDFANAYQFLSKLRGPVVHSERTPVSEFFGKLVHGTFQQGRVDFDAYWTTSPVRYRVSGADRLTPIKAQNDPTSVWRDDLAFSGFYEAPPDNQDVQFRHLHELVGNNDFDSQHVLNTPRLRVVGRFAPAKLPGFSPLSRVPLETYYPPTLAPASSSSRTALRGRALLPDQNLGGYIAQPPLALTTLAALPAFLDRKSFPDVTAEERRKPISVIRVRVAGATQPTALSRARIRTVAQLIHERTGLAVDITAGSSPHPLLIALPKGRFGRPPLLLREGWVRKGVAVVFLTALDRKDIGLFALILAVCTFFLLNSALASVRTRRTEVGMLLTLGWPRAAIFKAVLGELALIGLVAGTAGAGLALALALGLSLNFPPVDALYVLPLSVVLATAAGVPPAWRAARGAPLDVLRAPVAARSHGRGVTTFAGMAIGNLTRVPGRTAVGAVGLLIGVAALTILLGIEQAFEGTLVGTLLGEAISVQIRAADFVALGLTIALAAFSVADVLYLSIRERAAELVTLRTTGWSERHLAYVIGLEGLGLGLLGAGLGALAGLGIGSLLLSVPLAPLALAAGAAAAGGVLATLVASLGPLSQLRRISAPETLAAE